MNKINLWTTVLVTGCVAGSASAAVVTFGTPMAISAPSDVSLYGELHGASSFDNSAANTTVNDVLFIAVTYPGGGPPYPQDGSFVSLNESGGYPGITTSTGDAGYNALLNRVSALSPADSPQPITFTGLTIKQPYAFQIWSAQGAVGTWSPNQTTIASGASSVTLPSGTFVTGTFTADAATQALTWSGAAGTWGLINAIQIRALPVPEPSTLALLGAGLLALRLRRGRRIED